MDAPGREDMPPPLPSSSPPRDLEAGAQRVKPKLPSPKPQLSKEDLAQRSPPAGSPVRTLRQRSPSPLSTSTLGVPASNGSVNGSTTQNPLVTAPHLRKDLFSAPKVVSPTRLRKFGSGNSPTSPSAMASPSSSAFTTADQGHKGNVGKTSQSKSVPNRDLGLRTSPPRVEVTKDIPTKDISPVRDGRGAEVDSLT